MTFQHYGPADLYVVSFDQEQIPERVRDAVLQSLRDEVITLLDLVMVRRRPDRSLEVLEIENLGLEVGELAGGGLIGEDDLDDLLAGVEPGTSLLVILLENTWARTIAAAVTATGSQVVATQRFPADLVNQVAALAGVA